MDSSRLILMLMDDGWELVRVKGSHHQFKHRRTNGCVTVNSPEKDLPVDTVRAVLKATGLLNRLYSS